MGFSYRSNSAHMADIKSKGILYEDDDEPIKLTDHDKEYCPSIQRQGVFVWVQLQEHRPQQYSKPLVKKEPNALHSKALAGPYLKQSSYATGRQAIEGLIRAMRIGLFAGGMNRLGGRSMGVRERRQSLTTGTLVQPGVRRSPSPRAAMMGMWYVIGWCVYRWIVQMVQMITKGKGPLHRRGKVLRACRLIARFLHCSLQRVRVLIREAWVGLLVRGE
ncbi:hypothetical protein YC2023_114819 [Brassica napus]